MMMKEQLDRSELIARTSDLSNYSLHVAALSDVDPQSFTDITLQCEYHSVKRWFHNQERAVFKAAEGTRQTAYNRMMELAAEMNHRGLKGWNV